MKRRSLLVVNNRDLYLLSQGATGRSRGDYLTRLDGVECCRFRFGFRRQLPPIAGLWRFLDGFLTLQNEAASTPRCRQLRPLSLGQGATGRP